MKAVSTLRLTALAAGGLALGLVLEAAFLVYATWAFLALALFCRLTSRAWLSALEVTRVCPIERADPGARAQVRVEIRNDSLWPIPWLLATESLPKRLRKLGKYSALTPVRPGGKIVFKYALDLDRRGYYQIGPVVLETGDLFGIYRRLRVVLPAHYIIVYPRVYVIARYDIASRRPTGEIRISNRIYEDPTLVRGVRDYIPGDSQNRIHWRLSAKMGTLYSKEYDPSTVAGANIVLDFHGAGYPEDVVGEQRAELAVTLAASIAYYLYGRKQQFGLLSNGRDAAERMRFDDEELLSESRAEAAEVSKPKERSDRLAPIFVPTAKSEGQIQHVLEALARLELTDGQSLAEILMSDYRRLPRDATLFVIAPSVSDELALVLGRMKEAGFAVVVFLVTDSDTFGVESVRLAGQHIMAHNVMSEADLNEIRIFQTALV